MSWIYLFLAGLFEILWAVGLKYSAGFTRLWPSVGTASAMALSVVFLAMAAKTLPLGTAYAVWTGIGVIGAVALGIVLFNEPVTAARVACLALVVVGIAGLKLTA